MNIKKKQIIYIHGASTWASKEDFLEAFRPYPYDPYDNFLKWPDWVKAGLDSEYEFFAPTMPCREYADYDAWKIMFEKTFPYLNKEDLVLIGWSMGAIFLLRYLSENELPYRAKQVHIVAPSISDEGVENNEKIGNFQPQLDKLPRIQSQVEEIFLYHSKDDHICPFVHSQKIFEVLPEINFSIFEQRGHFYHNAFPELFANIPSDIYKK